MSVDELAGTLAWPLARAARHWADREAVVDGDVRRTYGQLSERVSRLGGGLDALGVPLGARVAVLSANSAPYLELALGVPRVARVMNALNTRLALSELTFILQDSGADVLVVDDLNLEAGRALRQSCPTIRHIVHLGPSLAPADTVAYQSLLHHGPSEPAAVGPDELATLCYTGGTTGRPKGVMLTHANLLANAKNMLATLPFMGSDRYLHAPPMFHAADAMMTFALTWVGGTHVIIGGFDPQLVPAVIEREGVTMTVLVPTMINMVLAGGAAQRHDLSSMRLLMYGASPMPEDLRRRAQAVFTCGWAQLYGMTEAAPTVTVLSPEDHALGARGIEPHATRVRGAGVPVVGVQAQVRRADGTPADVGEPGEIWVRGPNVMAGYWNRPEETANALAGGWYHTGDMAYEDADGYLYVVDRVKDMIISGGENVYSTEVESVIYEHPAVLEAAVVGVPDPLWGERVHAIVVLRDGASLDEAELALHCRASLAGFKVPRSTDIRLEPLPKSAAGKVLKRELRDEHWRGASRQV